MNIKNTNLLRQTRVRKKIKKIANGRYRLSIFRSLNNIYAQIIDDDKSTTILSSSTLDKKVKSKFKNTGNKEAASEIGKILGEKAKEWFVRNEVNFLSLLFFLVLHLCLCLEISLLLLLLLLMP